MKRIIPFEEWSLVNESDLVFDPKGGYPDKTFGLPKGEPHSGKVYPGGEGGDWGGSMQRALAFAKVAVDFTKNPNIISSQKRTKVVPGSSAYSDHSTNSMSSYAIDIACTGAEGDRILKHLMEWAGYPEYKGGYWLNFIKDGYRYQVGWRVENHYDHIHIGVRSVPGEKDTPGILSSTHKTSGSSKVPPKIKEILRKRSPSDGGDSEDEDSEDRPEKSKDKEEEEYQENVKRYKEYLSSRSSDD